MVYKLIQYSRERFPLFPVLIFTFSYAGLAVGLSPETIQFERKIILFFAFSLIFFLFLFRTRVVDEFKDESHDREYYPNRPIPRGFITKKELVLWGILSFILEIFAVAWLGFINILFYLPVVLYSILIAREFFVPRFLKQHFTLYYISHEILFIFFGFFYLASLGVLSGWTAFEIGLAIILMGVFPSLIEILRKFRPRLDTHGKVVKDSYAAVWGRTNTILIIVSFIVFMAAALAYLKSSNLFLFIGAIGMIVMIVPKKVSDKFILLITSLTLISFVLALYI